MCRLKAVLFASGAGGIASSYKPTRDESQWWNRRDALVRCVAAFLFGPRPVAHDDKRELVIIFSDDMARVHMYYDPPKVEKLVPLEKAIISIWKNACLSDGETIVCDGLRCQLIKAASPSTVPNLVDSKRLILNHLQKYCSIEFLRQERLNSASDVILRKMNKQTLVEAWERWQKRSQPPGSDLWTEVLSNTFQSGLGNKKRIAVILHESSVNEFPWWFKAQSSHDPDAEVSVFLGAVRDMSDTEQIALRKVCESMAVPLITIRLGPVAEFTSKILSIVAAHHSRGIIGPQALLEMNRKNPKRKREIDTTIAHCDHLEIAHCMHFVHFSTLNSYDLSTNYKTRDRNVWCIVRCVVASLWRSRLAGKERSWRLQNYFTIVFADNVVLTLEQEEFVEKLAGQHHAAPSEFQVLHALVSMLQNGKGGHFDRTGTFLHFKAGNAFYILHCLTEEGNGMDLVSSFYTNERRASFESSAQTAIILLPSPSTSSSRPLQQLLHSAEKERVPVLQCVSSFKCQDSEAATITFLQHMHYQNVLFPVVQSNFGFA